MFKVPPVPRRSSAARMNVKPFSVDDLAFHWPGPTVQVIEIVPGQITTRWVTEATPADGSPLTSEPERDLLKLVVVERHKGTGNIGEALAKGLGLERGALATSVAHDSHKIVALGVDDRDIFVAIKKVESSGGGLAAAEDGRIIASLPLPIAGLLSDRPPEPVVKCLEELDLTDKDLGRLVAAPFSVLSFLALPVVPELRLTDRGLVDVEMGRLLETVH